MDGTLAPRALNLGLPARKTKVSAHGADGHPWASGSDARSFPRNPREHARDF